MKTPNNHLSEPNDSGKLDEKAHLLKGDETFASYNDPGISLYRGNPFIEALPPILSEDEVIEKLAFLPPYDPEERKLPTHLRMQCINAATQFFQPLPRHVDLERRISSMIRTGYLARNPANPKYFLEQEQRIARLGKARNTASAFPHRGQFGSDTENRFRSSTTGFAIVGIPGIGKTTTVENILKRIYPQVIIHENYQGKRMPRSQVTWLVLGCPYSGSLRGLCYSFFQGIDLALNTNYYELYSQGKRNIDDLQDDMANLAGVHGLGVLVVDELQHLTCSGIGAEKMLNFFVDLANCLKVPVLLIGTFKAIPVLSNEFRQIRRNSGQGDMIWEAMMLDENWDTFIEALWEYQYTRVPTPLSPALSACLHDASQGITDFAVKMYMLAQVRAIANGGDEIITENIIRSVVLDSFRLAAPVLEAMRKKDWKALGEFEDVQSFDLASQIRGILTKPLGHHREQNKTPASKTEEIKPAVSSENLPSATQKGANRSRNKLKPKKITNLSDALPNLHAKAGKTGKAPYTTLSEAGIICPVTEFFEGSVLRDIDDPFSADALS